VTSCDGLIACSIGFSMGMEDWLDGNGTEAKNTDFTRAMEVLARAGHIGHAAHKRAQPSANGITFHYHCRRIPWGINSGMRNIESLDVHQTGTFFDT